ncbi:M14 family zinc carboxypeptidase [Dokdonia sp.]|uniref:M14 family zinc carboxypeptidase n=1 Tax=Dokdonia sp. TaxID=2024995 RepID=UPI003267B171
MMKKDTLISSILWICSTLFTITSLSAQSNLQAKRILINAPTNGQLQSIQQSGIDLHCGARFKGTGLELDLSGNEIAQLEQIGISYTTIIDDLNTFLINRAIETRPQAEAELRAMKEASLERKNTRASISTGETTIPSFIQREACDEIDWVSQNFRLGGFNDPAIPFGGCLTLDEVIIELDRMQSLYPDLISVRMDASPSGQQTWGNTTGSAADQFDPQTIWYVRISDNPNTNEQDEPESLITGMTHAREPSSLMNIIYYMWWLLENYESEPAIQNLIDHQEMYFMPVMNPDGLKWNEIIAPTGAGGQRKNLSPGVFDTGTTSFNNNRRGVDLNRNFDYYWGFDSSGSTSITSRDDYRGTSPASEPETQIVKDFVQSRDFKYAINHHSGLNAIITSSYNGDPNASPSGREDEYQKMLHDITRFNRYMHGSAPDILTNANGDTNDWMLGGDPITYTATNGITYTTAGSGKNIIAFSPENGDEFWPALTDFVPIAKRAVRMNLLTSFFAGKYARFHDLTPVHVETTTTTMDFAIEYLGQTSSDITIEMTPISANISVITPNITLQGLEILEQRTINPSITLDPSIQAGDVIEFQIRVSNDLYTIYETTITKYYQPSVLLDADSITNWSLSGTWSQTTNGYNGSTNAITTTPSPPYGNNLLSYATLVTPIDLSINNTAIIHFNVLWDLERNFDLVQLEASIDGGNEWIGLCGKYTKSSAQPNTNGHWLKPSEIQHQSTNGSFIYDGDLIVDGTDKWIMEEFVINPDNNQEIIGASNVLLRFKFDTDASNRTDGYNTNFEGFTFDNFKIIVMDQACDTNLISSFPYENTFENGIGFWIQNSNDDGNWTENVGATASPGTGPIEGNDTTASGGGTYLYLEASDPTNPQVTDPNAIGFNATAILTSSCIDLSTQVMPTFHFDYHMFGIDTGSLALEITTDTGVQWTELWSQSGQNPSQTSPNAPWVTQTIDLSSYIGQVIQLRFIGITGTDFRSDIAIDNLKITVPTTCPMTTTFSNGVWSNGIPDINTTAIIDSFYSTDLGNITACNLIINSGGSVFVKTNRYIHIENDIIVNGNLVSQNAGSIVQIQDDATTINNGTIRIFKRTPRLAPRDFILLSSPMTAETRQSAYGNADRVFGIIPENFIPYQGIPNVINFIDDNGDYLESPITNLNPSEGYILFPQPNNASNNAIYVHEYTLGTLNNGVITAPIHYNGPTTANNFNLLGNPYPSAIDADELITQNDALNEIYYWEHITNPNTSLPGPGNRNYDMDDVSIRTIGMGIPAVNGGTAPGQFMTSGQGFIMFADQSQVGSDVVFNNVMRVLTGNARPRQAITDNKLWLGLSTKDRASHSTTGITFTPETTPEIDAGYDSKRLQTSISLFSITENREQLAIQARESFDTAIEIDLGFSTEFSGKQEYTISLDKYEGVDLEQTSVFLIDYEKRTIVNLKKQAYTFWSNKEISTNRFKLVFKEKEVQKPEEIDSNDTLTLYPNPAKNQVQLTSNGKEPLLSISITDIQGKQIQYQKLDTSKNTHTIHVHTLPKGLYFVHVTNAQNVVVKKLLIE